jgi:hypothetical protein
MGYVTGEPILDDEYNNFLSSSSDPYGINHIFGIGDGAYGLGQTELSTAVTAGDVITATKWNSLFTAMDTVASHTNVAVTSTASRTAGDPIAVKAALVSDFASLASAVAGGSVNSSAVSAGAVDQAQVASSAYDQSHVSEVSFTFDGGDEARWFFNAGGRLRVAIQNGDVNLSSKDDVLNNLISQTGNFDLRATTSTVDGTGDGSSALDSTTGSDLNLGYYDLTTSYQTIYILTESTSTYSASYDGNIFIKIEAKTSAAHADGRGNNGEVVTIKVTCYVDHGTQLDYDAGNLAGAPVEANSAGPTTINHSTVDPDTTYLSTVYTNVAVASVSNTTNDSGS